MDAARCRRWQEAWDRAGIATGQRVPGRGKFYAMNAYPGPSGFLHVGTVRGLLYTDALHRFHRMLGESVLLPFGIHASGIPAVAFAQRVQDRDPAVVQQLDDAKVPEPERERLRDPEYAARYLGESYRSVLRSIGVLCDPTTYVTTIDEDYRAFIRWQFRALERTKALVRGTYTSSVCPVCGPVAVDPSETDLSSGGDAELLQFSTVAFRLDDGRYLLAATLRPETVFGVTNLWLRPDETLVVWHEGERSFLVARPGGERLVEQHGGHLGRDVPASELLGHAVEVPLRGIRVPVLPSDLVDPGIGTGVVMSVPAHAPADTAAMRALPDDVRASLEPPPVLVKIPSHVTLSPSESSLSTGTGTPAERALAATGASGLSDTEALEEATERLYRLEFSRGEMTVPALAGVPVREARTRVVEMLAQVGPTFDLQEFSKPVRCRNGHLVIIRKVPDQWFLAYGEREWKTHTKEYVARLVTWPTDYGRELPAIIDWFADRPCTRKGRWLGTPFPLDPEWIIEPIADSTFYMAYFLVRRFVSTGRIPVAQLTEAFFDYVFLGEGPGEPTVERKLLDEVRDEFLYWYPVDINLGGKEHKRVHFPVFLFTHARLLPPELQPRAIYVNGWITGPSGAKVSKKEVSSKGGKIPPLDIALENWGPDALRLFYAIAASPSQDVAWDPSLVDSAVGRLAEVERLIREAVAGDSAGPPELEAWLHSAMHRAVASVREAYVGTDLRAAAEVTYVGLPALLRRYYARGGMPDQATARVARAWIRLLVPITPHLAEELGEGRFPGLVSVERFPEAEEFPPSELADAHEAFLDRVEEDLRAVIRPAEERGERPVAEAVFFVAEPWKETVERWLRESVDRGEVPNLREVMARAASDPVVAAHRSEVAKYVPRVAPLIRGEPPTTGPHVDEVAALRGAEAYFARRLGFPSIRVVRESEAGELDPLGRRDRARPGRPAFYLRRQV
ncbi:MAG TPA: class I tRNA ligase family protein [Thermoplasmata archaeon]|nr:class I tRNA ligase family protein [Thermoplasmata archaeon]